MGNRDEPLSGTLASHLPRSLKRLWVLPALLLLIFLVYPLIRLTATAWTADTLNALLDSTLWQVVLLASAQAMLSVGLSLLIGIPIARVLFTYQFLGRGFILALVTIPFVLPTVVVALGFRSLFGDSIPNGLLLVVIAHAYINIAVVIRLVGAQWSTLDRRMEVTAATLGAGPMRIFSTITLPALRNSIMLASAVVFIFSFSSLGIVVVLGDGSGTRTLEQVLLRSTSVLLDFPTALAAAILQLVVVGVVFVISARVSRNEPRAKIILERARIRGPQAAFVVTATCLVAVTLVLAPIASIFGASVSSSDGLTAGWWSGLANFDNARIGSPLEALGRSVGLALFTSVIAAILGGAIAIAVMSRKGIVATLALIPLGVSAVTLGLGILLAFSRGSLDLRGTGALIPITHALIAVPIVVAVATPSLRTVDPRRYFVALSLGAGHLRAWWTAFGTAFSGVMLAAGGLAAAVSLGEFGAATLLSRTDAPTVPVQIARLLSKPGESAFATAAVLSVILVVVTMSLLLVVDRIASRRVFT
ncbi:MAG: iron ABC transporter permease [Actinobacteria bacterium]|nr:iron ABC transporter permease [Actinomycetota bacterium]